MKLHEVHQGVRKNKKRKRIGRGTGSGHGKTAGRGHKGQGSRAGWGHKPTFQGGAMPLVRRVPKRGFTNKWAPLLGHRFDEIKILGDGELTKKFTVSAHRFSKSAAEKIEKAGGQVVHLPGRVSVEEKKKLAKQGAK